LNLSGPSRSRPEKKQFQRDFLGLSPQQNRFKAKTSFDAIRLTGYGYMTVMLLFVQNWHIPEARTKHAG
jgi:hypothetical protein